MVRWDVVVAGSGAKATDCGEAVLVIHPWPPKMAAKGLLLLLGKAQAGAELVPGSPCLQPSGRLSQVILQGLQQRSS